jgi:hypothetical protein
MGVVGRPLKVSWKDEPDGGLVGVGVAAPGVDVRVGVLVGVCVAVRVGVRVGVAGAEVGVWVGVAVGVVPTNETVP